MELEDAKERFIQAWGVIGTQWGINRTMAQIHALLLVAPEPLSTEDIMAQLMASRGNVNMNVRELIDWGLVRKEYRMGERREYFVAEKDMWKVAKLIIIQRKKKELQPLVDMLQEVGQVDAPKGDKEAKAFKEVVEDIYAFAVDADKMLDRMIRADEHWFLGTFMRLIR